MKKRFNRWTIINPDSRMGKYVREMECQCDCGTIRWVSLHSLSYNKSKSCGCLKSQVASGLNRLPALTATFNSLFSRYKNGAKIREHGFTLTKPEAMVLFQSDCYYCGAHPSQTHKVQSHDEGFLYNGIDRVDNKIGYTRENSVACCPICNRAKMDRSLEEFNSWLARITSHRASANTINLPADADVLMAYNGV